MGIEMDATKAKAELDARIAGVTEGKQLSGVAWDIVSNLKMEIESSWQTIIARTADIEAQAGRLAKNPFDAMATRSIRDSADVIDRESTRIGEKIYAMRLLVVVGEK